MASSSLLTVRPLKMPDAVVVPPVVAGRRVAALLAAVVPRAPVGRLPADLREVHVPGQRREPVPVLAAAARPAARA